MHDAYSQNYRCMHFSRCADTMCFSNYYLVFVILAILGACESDQKIYPPLNGTDGMAGLHIGVLLPSGSTGLSRSVAGVRCAVDDVNNSTWLNGCKLHYIQLDTQCRRREALQSLFQLGTATQKSVGVIGAGCSNATEATAEISHLFGYSQISCQSSSPELGNREQFPRYFQFLPSISEVVHAFTAILKEFLWRHVTLIAQDIAPYELLLNQLKNLLSEKNITFSAYLINTDRVSSMDLKLFESSEERIFIILTEESFAASLLCMAAMKQAHLQATRVFITQFYSPNWYQNLSTTNTSACDIESVLHRSLAVAYFEPFLDNEEFNPYCYDATIFLATALKYTLGKYNFTCEEGNLLAQNKTILDEIFNSLQDLSQQTMDNGKCKSGEVKFDKNGIRETKKLPLYQYRYLFNRSTGVPNKNLELINFGSVIKNKTYIFSYEYSENNTTVFPDGIPYDGKPVTAVTTLFLPVTVVFHFLASIGILFALACFIFNCKYRNHKVVRMTSPKLNYLIIAGVVIFYIDTYFFTLPTLKEEEVRLTCNAETWFTAVGYTLCYGTIMAKMFRVWIIFRNPKPKMRTVISDWLLIAGVMVLLGVDLIILTVFTIIEQAGIGGELIRLTENREYPTENGVQNLRYYCDSKPHDIVSGFFYGFKGLLQVVALALAFMTRKVKVKGLDDAKYIAAIIYMTSITISVLTVVEYSLDDYINTYASIFATGLLLSPTCVLLLVFVPTMVRLHRDPKGEHVFVPPTCTSTFTEDQTILTLKTRVRELEDLLSTVTSKEDKMKD